MRPDDATTSQGRTVAPSPYALGPLEADALRRLDGWWRAANYLSGGQIYLLDNPLLRRPLEPADVKPRLLGHWGLTPGLNLTYVHANRCIVERGLDAIYVMGPGHGGPGPNAAAWLEPLAASWHCAKFLDPATDGAVLPVLHLNGYKIANPTVPARIPEDELRSLPRTSSR